MIGPSKPYGNLCVMCEHFWFTPSEPHYSTWTPGSDMAMGCYKNHWSEREPVSTDDFRATLRLARDCKDFTLHKEDGT